MRALVQALKQAGIDSGVSFTEEATPNATGYFEVYVNGKLVHSKKAGDGYVDTPQKLEKIWAAIDDARSVSA
ncbi:hypothetical protein WJX72_002555 [[Myrmecia] bisecta]|uniref:Selenoprotein W n=1 Tax=[Myrmecia] bisecta TaxID=41462 RepID=A0AAW1Q0I4_9CHLO